MVKYFPSLVGKRPSQISSAYYAAVSCMDTDRWQEQIGWLAGLGSEEVGIAYIVTLMSLRVARFGRARCESAVQMSVCCRMPYHKLDKANATNYGKEQGRQ
ncbi:unnamed protein product [Pleuronectes platessa]|uniref:Uncharacterized protein n=1 Tax=Pleuronectes platessa TaxID=8262 RepID=A0A9N7Z674_PLEPL|nr:unnamed protein product [Pleuronectes platessa]